MKEIIILNGMCLSGKDSFVTFCNKYAKCKNISTVDKVKEAYALLGWDGDKSEQHRKALSDIKDIGTTNLDHPYTYIKSEIEKFYKSDEEIMFIHSREPDEIDRFKKAFGCITILVENPQVKQVTSNHADRDVNLYQYDYTILNNSTLEDLDYQAMNFVKYLRGEY